MLVFNLISHLLWAGGGSSVSSVAFLGFRELKQIEKHAHSIHIITYAYNDGGESNGKLPLRTCPGCSVPEPYQSPD